MVLSSQAILAKSWRAKKASHRSNIRSLPLTPGHEGRLDQENTQKTEVPRSVSCANVTQVRDGRSDAVPTVPGSDRPARRWFAIRIAKTSPDLLRSRVPSPNESFGHWREAMNRLFRLTVAAMVAAVSVLGKGLAQQPAVDNAPSAEYVYEVRGSRTAAPAQDRCWSQFYDTEAAALARLEGIAQEYAHGGILELSKDKPLGLRVERFTKATADLAKMVKEAKGAVDAAEHGRKLGDTLKEYSSRIKDVYKMAVDAKRNLTSMTGTIARKQFDAANKLIDSFNRTRAEFSRASQEAAGSSLLPGFTSVLSQYPQLARVTPQDLKGKLEAAAPTGKYQVWVFKNEGGRWVKQEDRTLDTNDDKQARKYVADVKAVQGWTATSNLPLPEKENGPNGSLEGTTWGGGTFNYSIRFEKGGRAIDSGGVEWKWSMKGNYVYARQLVVSGQESYWADEAYWGRLKGDVLDSGRGELRRQ
jgi:hypothetical protein